MRDASETTAFGQKVDSRSESRYHQRPSRFHFFRLRSSPSTFKATGMPASRGSHVNTAVAALQ